MLHRSASEVGRDDENSCLRHDPEQKRGVVVSKLQQAGEPLAKGGPAKPFLRGADAAHYLI